MNENEMFQMILDKLENLEKGQVTMMRNIKQLDQKIDGVDQKLDRLTADAGQTLAILTETVDEELRKAK